MRTLIINFSGRISKGNSESIGRYLCDILEGEVRLVNYSTLNISSCNKCDYECFISASNCRYINDDLKSLYDSILCSDNIFFVLPVYSDYPCSNYFAFRERSQCYFNEPNYTKYSNTNLKLIIIANTGFDNVVKVVNNDFPFLTDSSILHLSSQKFNTKSVNGDLIQYKNVQEQVYRFVKTHI